MPVYESKCSNPECGHEVSEVRPMSKGPRKRCPKCKHKLETQFGTPMVRCHGYMIGDPRSVRGRFQKERFRRDRK